MAPGHSPLRRSLFSLYRRVRGSDHRLVRHSVHRAVPTRIVRIRERCDPVEHSCHRVRLPTGHRPVPPVPPRALNGENGAPINDPRDGARRGLDLRVCVTFLTVLAAVLLLSSCAAGPNTAPPWSAATGQIVATDEWGLKGE